MSQFSNQYAKKFLNGEGDFCIFKEARRLKPGYYKKWICEGYGFIAICKEEDKTITVAIPVAGIYDVKWTPLEELGIKRRKNLLTRIKRLLPKKYF